MTILGFTGTRNTPTDLQLSWLWKQYDDIDEFHHGCCVGADQASDQAARDNSVDCIIGHPPIDERLMMPRDPMDCWLPAKPYHARNRDIVDACDKLIALPDGPQRPHSGTWYTIDYATGKVDRHLSKNVVPVTICYPNGELEKR